MLLLLLFAGCLATCAAQTTSFPSTTIEPATMFSPSIQATSVEPTTDTSDDVVAFLLTAVQSTRELNETTIGPVLQELHSIIRQLQPDLDFSLIVRNITRV